MAERAAISLEEFKARYGTTLVCAFASIWNQPVGVLASIGRARLSTRVRSIRAANGELSLALADGMRVLLGDGSNLPLKLAALREICSLPCDELTDLEREIAIYVKKQRRAVHAE